MMFLRARSTARVRRTQAGVSMIILLLMIGVVGVGIFFGIAHSGNEEKLKRDRKTEIALARAKQALLDYAVQYDQTHVPPAHPQYRVAGYLPCPDTGPGSQFNGEGNSSLTCRGKNISAIGRLPWRTLDLEDLRDGNGECLWYAVSGTFKNTLPNTDLPFNWDAAGQFEVYSEDGTPLAGSIADNWIAAVIIAPGLPQGAAQTRSGLPETPVCGGNYTFSNYLDSVAGMDNGALSVPPAPNIKTKFVQAQESNTFNDRLVYITAADIFNAIERRPDFYGSGGLIRGMLKKAAECIKARADTNTSVGKSLVWAADNSNFGSTKYFTIDAKYKDDNSRLLGRVPYDIGESNAKTNGTSDQLVVSSDCSSTSDSMSAWWKEWREQFFYAVAKGQAPNSAFGDCTADGSCLRVNGSGPYAGVVFFGGRKMAGQNRVTATNRRDPINYLESTNWTTTPGPSGGDYVTNNDPKHAALNDLTYCIKPDLSVFDCH